MTDLNSQKDKALSAIGDAGTLDALEAERLAALGKKGWVSLALKTLGQMSPEDFTAEIQSAWAKAKADDLILKPGGVDKP